LKANLGGGLYVTTIQKFAEGEGMLSDRPNIICLSDEAHRSQVDMGSHMKIVTEEKEKGKKQLLDNKEDKVGAFFTETFARQLHNSLPYATFVGFTGTPIEETIQVFGAEVDRYTMEEAKNDQIAQLRQQLSMADLRASQTAQNAFISQGFANEVDALYNRLNTCPVPTTPVYGRTPIFTCPQQVNNCGCGCGGSF
jgi:type I site-specific restriction-modification system R (restriction) subunit